MAQTKQMTKPAGVAPTSGACTHHWVIDGPEGPESHGRCRRCGEERLFQNTPARVPFDRSTSTNGGYRSGVRWSVREEIRLADE